MKDPRDYGQFILLWPHPEIEGALLPEQPVIIALLIQYGHLAEGVPMTQLTRVILSDTKGRIISSKDYEMEDVLITEKSFAVPGLTAELWNKTHPEEKERTTTFFSGLVRRLIADGADMLFVSKDVLPYEEKDKPFSLNVEIWLQSLVKQQDP